MEREIIKVKRNKKDIATIHWHVGQDNARKGAKLMSECEDLIHKDFSDALDKLAPHYAILTGYVKPGPVKNVNKLDDPVVASFHVSGFGMSGDAEDQCVIITGHRILPNGQAIILNTPLTRLADVEEGEETKSRYKFVDELLVVLGECQDEAIKYIDGKIKPNPQMKMELADTQDNENAA